MRHLGNLDSPPMYDLMSVETAIDLSKKTLQHGVKMLHYFQIELQNSYENVH